MYELHKGTLGEIEGRGYAFKRDVGLGKARHGIFYPDDPADLETLKSQGEATFTGTLYTTTRASEKSFDVAIKSVTRTRMGDRVDFEALDNP